MDRAFSEYGIRVERRELITPRLLRLWLSTGPHELALYALIQGESGGMEDEVCRSLGEIGVPCARPDQVQHLVARQSLRLEKEMPGTLERPHLRSLITVR